MVPLVWSYSEVDRGGEEKKVRLDNKKARRLFVQ